MRNIPYALSRDYAAAYALICKGYTLVGFVDYTGYDEVQRDVTMIKRHKEFDIFIGVRGTCYATVWEFEQMKELTEFELFARACERTNLEWLVPSAEATR